MSSHKRSYLTRRDFVRLAGAGFCFGRQLLRAQGGQPGPIRMENVAPGCGIDFVLRNDARGRKYQVETVLGGLGVIDFDHDGWPDLYCVNGAALPSLQKNDPRFYNRLYRNNHNGIFTDVTEKAGLQGHGYEMGAAVGDYNNDGLEDLYLVGVHGNTLYRNNGDGTFSDVTETAGVSGHRTKGDKLWSVAAAWIDYDNDGHLDLLISNYCDWTAGTDPVCGGLNGAARAYCHPDKYRAEPLLVYHNNGNGTFTEVSQEIGLGKILGKGMGVAVADFDADGFADVFIANDNARNLLIHNLAGKMKEIGLEAGVAYNGDGRQISGMGADFGDIDGDGRLDIVMTGLRGETYELFRNRGDGTFEDASAPTGLVGLSRGWSGWGCGLVDLDNVSAALDDVWSAGFSWADFVTSWADPLCEELEERGWFLTDQFAHPANPRVHEATTGPEVLAQCGARVGAFVCGIGTGGRLLGHGKSPYPARAACCMIMVR